MAVVLTRTHRQLGLEETVVRPVAAADTSWRGHHSSSSFGYDNTSPLLFGCGLGGDVKPIISELPSVPSAMIQLLLYPNLSVGSLSLIVLLLLLFKLLVATLLVFSGC